MANVSFVVAGILFLVVVFLSVVATSLKRELNEFSRHESLGFVRLGMVGAFGILISQGISSFGTKWWISALISLAATAVLLFASQLVAKQLGPTKFAIALGRFSMPFIRSLDLAFTPIASKPIDAPEEFEQEFMESVEDFGETVVREIMVPRIDMETVSADLPLASALTEFISTGYSRLPVRRRNIDDLVGVLYLKDVAKVFAENPDNLKTLTAEKLSRKAMFVPDSKPVDELLKDMQLNATHVAVVVDEYGGVAGLVTMEDVIEELVGEITDEYDRERPDIEPLANDCYRVSAKSSLFELGEHIGLALEDEDIDSVGGLVTKLIGRLPRGGDEVHFSGLTFTAERFEGRDKRLVTVLVSVDPEVVSLRDSNE